MSVGWSPQRWNRLQRVAMTATITLLAAVCQAQTPASRSTSSKLVLYASVGPDLSWYDVDVEHATLVKQGSTTLPANVQEAWPHPSKQYLYVAWSNGGPSSAAPGSGAAPSGSQHGVSTFQIDKASGALHPHGQPASLRSRPIHMTTDVLGAHVLVAYNDPSGVTVHSIRPDGSVGSEVKQATPLDVGIYAHQVRVEPSNTSVILVTRGNGPAGGKPEDPGAVKIFSYKDGLLTNRASIAPGGGFNFQPRHLDFHPSRPWVFVTLERQNKLQVYTREPAGTLGSKPLFTKETLTAPNSIRPGQAVGTVHVHPNGQFVYVANRASGTTEFEGKPVFVGGENAIAVYRITQDTGEPTLVQNIDTRGMHPRTFAIDSTGRILVAANQMSLSVREGSRVNTVPASLAVFQVGADGKLDFKRAYNIELAAGRSLFWSGLVSLP
jgi:6-phosphogluconolactonase